MIKLFAGISLIVLLPICMVIIGFDHLSTYPMTWATKAFEVINK